MKIYIPEPIAEAGEKYLEFQGYEIFRGSGQTDRESLIRDIAECDAMILRTAKMDEEVLEDGKKLRIVARHGAGYDNPQPGKGFRYPRCGAHGFERSRHCC